MSPKWVFIFPTISLVVRTVTGFVADPVSHSLTPGAPLDDATHASITEAGIKKAVWAYFREKSSAKQSGVQQTLDGQISNTVNVTVDAAISAESIFRAYYGAECVLNVIPFQKAIVDIQYANADTDLGQSGGSFGGPEFHFDSERFTETNANIIAFRNSAKTNIAAGKYSEARIDIGHGLHGIQDFYSHSNWVDLGNKQPNPGLGNPNNDFGVPLAEPTEATCTSCPDPYGECKDNIATNKLTSGYYVGMSKTEAGQKYVEHMTGANVLEQGADGTYAAKQHGKCSHGGFDDATAQQNPKGGINKDMGALPYSQHYALHHQAANLAEQSTISFFNALRKEIGDDQFENLLQLKQPQCNSPQITPGQGQLTFARRRRAAETAKKEDEKESTFVMAVSIEYAAEDDSAKKPVQPINYGRPVTITSLLANFSTGPIGIPIDPTIKILVIEMAPVPPFVENSKLLVSLVTPTGAAHNFNDKLESHSNAYLRIPSPQPGIWRLHIAETKPGSTIFQTTVLGASTWDAIIAILAQTERMRHVDRPGVRLVKPDEQVQPGSTLFAYVMVPTGRITVKRLEIRGANGSLLDDEPVAVAPTIRGGFTRYFFAFTVPREKFQPTIRAVDENGYIVERASEHIYTPEEEVCDVSDMDGNDQADGTTTSNDAGTKNAAVQKDTGNKADTRDKTTGVAQTDTTDQNAAKKKSDKNTGIDNDEGELSLSLSVTSVYVASIDGTQSESKKGEDGDNKPKADTQKENQSTNSDVQPVINIVSSGASNTATSNDGVPEKNTQTSEDKPIVTVSSVIVEPISEDGSRVRYFGVECNTAFCIIATISFVILLILTLVLAGFAIKKVWQRRCGRKRDDKEKLIDGSA